MGKTLEMYPKRVVPNGAGVYSLTVDLGDSCLQYIGSTCDLGSRYFGHFNKFLYENNTTGMYKYVRDNNLLASCK
jgi:hypothetical protein